MNIKSIFHPVLMAAVLAGLAWGFQPVAPALAAGMVVTSLSDTQANDGVCTLREAILNANNNNTSGSSDCTAGSGADSLTFSIGGTITLGSMLPAISDASGLTIDGANGVTISGNSSVKAFLVNVGIPLTLKNLTLSNGKSTNHGGAIENRGLLTVDHCTFSANITTGEGGAIWNWNDTGTSLTVANSTFSGNTATSNGSAIRNYYGDMQVDSSSFESNISTGGNGGGIYTTGITGDNISVSNSYFHGNRGDSTNSYGGGIYTWGPLTNTTFYQNNAVRGGGIFNDGAYYGGQYLTLAVINSTFRDNASGATGGGIYNNNANSATTVLKNTIMDNHGVSTCSGTITNGGNNLDYGITCGFGTTNGSLSSTNPNLGALTGSPAYFPLNSGSPAIDRVTWSSPNSCPAADQRGVPRPQGTYCDIGAYEVQKVLVVTPGGQASGFCGGSTDACDLQYALTSAVSGQEIHVVAGTYKPTSGIDRSATFQLKNGVAIYGGYASSAAAGAAASALNNGVPLRGGFSGSGMLRDARDPVANPTILSGEIGTSSADDNSCHVVTGASGAILDGITITRGYAQVPPCSDAGGGMYNDNSSPSLKNVTFISNSALNFGGGMYNNMSSPILTDVTFKSNSTSYMGGGMYNTASNPSLTNVTFSSNTSSSYGGGMGNINSSPTLTNVTFNGNSTGEMGGGMYNNASSPSLTNVTFSGNSAAANYGGGMYNYRYSSPVIKDSIFWGNGSEIAFAGYEMFYVNDSLVQGGCPGGAICNGTILNADPLLGALADNGGFTLTMALGSGSPAIDAGNNATCAATDQRGVTRPQGLYCDLGAYESNGPTHITLRLFTAKVEKTPAVADGRSVILSWETTSEFDNLGFNLYRSTALDGARVKLNAGLIPTLVPPGSQYGAVYNYTDTSLMDGKTYYYWLEAVDIHGGKELTGPVWVKLVAGKNK
jgi:CSLREA domain-containing protein